MFGVVPRDVQGCEGRVWAVPRKSLRCLRQEAEQTQDTTCQGRMSTMPGAQLSKTAPPKTWKPFLRKSGFPSLYSGCGIAHFFKHNLVLIEVNKNASISVCPPLLVTRGTFASASISALTLTCRDLAQVNLGWTNLMKKFPSLMEKSVWHDSIPGFLSIHVQPFWQLKHCPGVSGEYKHCQLIGFIF